MRTIITLILLVTFINTTSEVCNSAPAAPVKADVSQPDGLTFQAIGRGDEWQNWTETDTGYTVIRDNNTGWWYYAIPDDKEGIKASEHPVGKVNPEYFGIQKELRPKRQEHPNQLPPRRYLEGKDTPK